MGYCVGSILQQDWCHCWDGSVSLWLCMLLDLQPLPVRRKDWEDELHHLECDIQAVPTLHCCQICRTLSNISYLLHKLWWVWQILILTLLGLSVTTYSLQGEMHTDTPNSTTKARVDKSSRMRHPGDDIACMQSHHLFLCASDFISVLLLFTDGLWLVNNSSSTWQ